MRVTEISILMAALWSTIFILLTYMLRKKRVLSPIFSISCFMIIYLFSMVRMLFPIDFILSRGIIMEGFFSRVYEKICLDSFSIANQDITIYQIVLIIWIVGSFVETVRCAYHYKNIMQAVLHCEKWDDKQGIMEQIYKDTGKKIPVCIRISKAIGIPMVIGVQKKTILLPEEEYCYKELYYILLHEYTHILNKDLLVKWFIQICGIIFWWNPIFKILQKEISRELEIRCDLSVTMRLTTEGTSEYLQTIINTLKYSSNRKKMKIYNAYGVAALIRSPQEEVVERFHMVVNTSKKKKTYVNQIYMGIFLFLFLVSYSFVPQPSYEEEIDRELMEEESIEDDLYILTPSNSYIIKDKDGRYHWIREGVMDDIISGEEREELRLEGFPERDERR